MSVAQKIQESVARLPESRQAEVLDFVEYLLTKADRDTERHEAQLWSSFALAEALRDADDEHDALYTLADLRMAFK
jgi:hypothetical protein